MQLSFKLSPIAKEVLLDNSRYKIVCAGRRWGKTQLIVPHIYKHLSKPFFNVRTGEALPHNIGYYSPSYKQSEEIFWQRALDGLRPITKKVNNTLLRITFTNGGILQLFGTDVNPDALRGSYKTFVIRDEAAHQDGEVFTTIVSPMLADVKGDLLDISTPDGFELFYDHWIRGNDNNETDWKSWQSQSYEGGYITKEYQEEQRRYFADNDYQQEWLAEFVGKTGRVYYAFDRNRNVTAIYPQEGRELHWGWDFNQIPACHSVLCYKGDDCLFQFDEICTGDTPQIMKDFIAKYQPGFFSKIWLYGDATKVGQTTSGISDYDIMHNMLIANGYGKPTLKIMGGNPQVRNRTNHVNRLLCDASGMVRLLIDKSCFRTIRDMEKLSRSEKSGKIDKTSNPELSHASDALGYLAFVAIVPQYKVY